MIETVHVVHHEAFQPRAVTAVYRPRETDYSVPIAVGLWLAGAVVLWALFRRWQRESRASL